MSRIRIPLAVGNSIGLLGTAFAVLLTIIAADIAENPLRLVLYVISWGSLVFFPHCLTHFIVGRMVGIRFTNYSLGRSGIARLRMPIISAVASKVPVLTLRIEKSSLRSSSRGGRAVMFASGAAASMILPFFVGIVSFRHLPVAMSLFLLALSVANMAFDFYYSPKAGDMSKIMIRH